MEGRMRHQTEHDPVARLNDHHADDVLATARAFGGHPDAVSARVERIDRDGIDVTVDSPRGPMTARVTFAEPIADTGATSIRLAFRTLARHAKAALAADGTEPSAP
jgi:putative heme iron utilization protein